MKEEAENQLLKREQFAISLRNEKRSSILSKKRLQNLNSHRGAGGPAISYAFSSESEANEDLLLELRRVNSLLLQSHARSLSQPQINQIIKMLNLKFSIVAEDLKISILTEIIAILGHVLPLQAYEME